MSRNNWTREETIIAFNVYCKVPFKSSSKTNPTIVKYAKIIGRSPSALNMKVGNFGRLDPALKRRGIVGLAHGSKLEEEIWEEFNGDWEKLAYESEWLIAEFANRPIEVTSGIEADDLRDGIEREAVVKQRVNQGFFRSAVLSSYYSTCCVTGLSVPGLLVASHIVPWSQGKENRLDPRNGLCLNAIHDSAFDGGFMTITPDFTVRVSDELKQREKEKAVHDFFLKFENQKITLPDRFLPAREFLDYHHQHIFRK